jgi:hypothetical protein
MKFEGIAKMKWHIAWYIFVRYDLKKFPKPIAEWVYKNVGL